MKKILIAVFLMASICNYGQETLNNGEEELGSWFMYFGTNKLNDKWSLHTEAQFRYYENAANFNQLLLRTAMNYHINPNAIASFGYGFIETDGTFEDLSIDDNSIEHRIFEQFILKNKVGEFSFEHRYRLEQRFITQGQKEDDSFSKSNEHRARYRLQITLPLTDIFFLNFYDEIFINLQGNVFGQNRLYGALGVNVTENLSVQAGYLKNHFTNVNYDRVQFGLFYNPDLTGVFKKSNN